MTTGERIKKRRLECGVPADVLAHTLGVSRSTIFRYENGAIEKIPITILRTLAIALNTSSAYLLGITDNPIRTLTEVEAEELRRTEHRGIPILGEVACGQPLFMNENFDATIDIDNPIDADFCLTAKGDSMINLGIADGTIVFIKKQSTVDNGDVAVVAVENEATLKRVYYYKEENLLILRAENPNYRDMVFRDNDLNRITILGKAVAYQNRIF